MIKPKSRKHEERIKALEERIVLAERRQDAQRAVLEHVLTRAGWKRVTKDEWELPESLTNYLPWWKRLWR